MENRGLSLDVQLEILGNVRAKIASIRGQREETLQKKLDDICGKNEGLRQLSDIHEAVCHGTRVSLEDIPIDPSITSAYMYASLVSVDAERTFNDY